MGIKPKGLKQEADEMLVLLKNMTPSDFERGADKPIREFLARVSVGFYDKGAFE